jgi:hypothetical protein
MQIQPVDPATILANLRTGYPRLLLTPQRLTQLRQQTRENARPREWLARLRQRADQPVTIPGPDEPGLFSSRHVMERLLVLSTVGALTEDAAYAAAAAEAIRCVTKWEDWQHPTHRAYTIFDLSMAEVCASLALCRDLLGEALPEETHATAARWIREQGLPRALVHYRRPAGQRYWPDEHNNWNQVCNGGVILAALSIADTDPALAAECLVEAVRSLPNAMQEFAPDGGSLEGPGYWRYGSLFNCLALDALQNALGTDFGLGRAPGMDRTGSFFVHCSGPFGRQFNYSDCRAERMAAPHLWWLARRFGEAWLAAARLRMIEEDARLLHRIPPGHLVHDHGVDGLAVHYLDLLWYDHALAEAASEAPALDSHFKRAGVATLRSSWDGAQATFVGFRAGCSSWHHAHLDSGSFVLDALGQRWAEDFGGDSYSLPAYFEIWGGSAKRHYSYYRIRAEGHNTLVLNPHLQPQQDPAAEAMILRTGSYPDHAVLIADLGPAYRRQVGGVLRGIRLDRQRGDVLLRDEVLHGEAVDYWWFMHTRAQATVAEDRRSVVLEMGGQRLWVGLVTPDKAGFEIMDARPMVHSPDPAGQNPNEGCRKLAIHLEVVVNPAVTVWFVPLKPGEAAPAVLPAVESLGSWW